MSPHRSGHEAALPDLWPQRRLTKIHKTHPVWAPAPTLSSRCWCCHQAPLPGSRSSLLQCLVVKRDKSVTNCSELQWRMGRGLERDEGTICTPPQGHAESEEIYGEKGAAAGQWDGAAGCSCNVMKDRREGGGVGCEMTKTEIKTARHTAEK